MSKLSWLVWPDFVVYRCLDTRAAVVSTAAYSLDCRRRRVSPVAHATQLRAGDSVDTRNPDEDAKARFAQVVLPHLPAAFALARSLTRNSSDAEDVVQEACLRAYRAIGGTTVANARAWVLTIVHNTARTWLSTNRSAAIFAVDNLEAAEQQSPSIGTEIETPEAAVIAKTDSVRLKAAMADLPPKFREVLVLREIEGLSYREIAEVTGVPIGTVMSRLARAREQLISAIGRHTK